MNSLRGIVSRVTNQTKNVPLTINILRRHLASRSDFDPHFMRDPDVSQTPTTAVVNTADLPLMTSRKFTAPITRHQRPRQAWLETLESSSDVKLGIVDLHPDVFAAIPRIDLIYENLRWQGLYRQVDYRCITTRSELTYRSQRKPWQQKGLGKARHGTRRSPLFIGGAQSKGPRGPEAHFYILPDGARVNGLLSALSVRYAQDDLHIVDDFAKLPTDSPTFLEELVVNKNWGDSVLFVNETDQAPENLALACDAVPHYNLLPVYGLNVWSIIKHDTLVLSLGALERIEEKLLHQLHKCCTRPLTNPPWNEFKNTYFTGFQHGETYTGYH